MSFMCLLFRMHYKLNSPTRKVYGSVRVRVKAKVGTEFSAVDGKFIFAVFVCVFIPK